MGASDRGGDEGDPSSQGAARQNQQTDGRLPPEGIQDAGRVLRCVWGEGRQVVIMFVDLGFVLNVKWCREFVCVSRQFFFRTGSRKTTVSPVRSWTLTSTRTTLVSILSLLSHLPSTSCKCSCYYSISSFFFSFLSALNAQAALSQVRERQLAAQSPAPTQMPELNGVPHSSQANASVPQPRPEHCEGAAAGGRSLLPPPVVPSPSAASTTNTAPARPPACPQNPALQPVLQEAEEAVLTKLRWATTQLQSSASLEASIQLCSLITSCANSLRSLKELSQ